MGNSYSMLGNVYKLPKGFKGDTFLAGRHNDWNVEEVEVWAVNYWYNSQILIIVNNLLTIQNVSNESLCCSINNLLFGVTTLSTTSSWLNFSSKWLTSSLSFNSG